MEKATVHIPVLLDEVVSALSAANGGRFLDCTLGGGGHSEAILKANSKNTVLGIDRDLRALERARVRLSEFGDRFSGVHCAFSHAEAMVERKAFDGMLVDLGLSTDQLKEDRGFSFKGESKLDMRMDESTEFSADIIVNKYSFGELLSMFRRGGVGNEAAAVAKAIVAARPIQSSKELSAIINKAAARLTSKKKINPSTVVFQSIRIEVNQEFEEIHAILESAPRIVKEFGRLAIITFHSIEDQLVTKKMREWHLGDDLPASWRGPRKEPLGKFLSTKAIVPNEEEISRNPASRSARLRVFEFGEI